MRLKEAFANAELSALSENRDVPISEVFDLGFANILPHSYFPTDSVSESLQPSLTAFNWSIDDLKFGMSQLKLLGVM